MAEEHVVEKLLKETGGILHSEDLILEAYALMKIAKSGAKLGLELVPPHLREKLTREIASVFEKEIAAIMERAL